jgi:hypothetical protein
MKKIFSIILITFFIDTSCKEGGEIAEEIEPIKIGNFALPTSQEPGPLFSFGQFILDKGDFVSYLYTDYFKGFNKQFLGVSPGVVYGIRDDFTLFIDVPIVTNLKSNNLNRPKTFAGFLIQAEYVFYGKNTQSTADQMTFVVNAATFPENSATITPRRVFESPNFLLGFTASHTSANWYYFTSIGTILTGKHNTNKTGNLFLYQFGISQNIAYKTDKWIFNWMLEFNGIYRQKDKILGKINPDSGGNQIFLGPSLWFSNERIIVHGGISFAVHQHLNGNQTKDKYFAAINLGLKFN